MLRIDEARKGRLSSRVVGLGRLETTRVLCCRDDLEALVLQLLIKRLPPGQVLATASPGGPGQQQDLLAPEIRQSDRPPLSILHKTCGQPTSALVACSHCHREIDIKDVTYRDSSLC